MKNVVLPFSNYLVPNYQLPITDAQLFLLIGLPGSGKSSLAQRVTAQYPQCCLISTDAIRAQLFGNESIQGSWLLIWEELQRQFEQAVEQIWQEAATAAIYDATNAIQKQRREAIALAHETGFTHITGLWLNTPIEVCLERNRKRDRFVPEEVILSMYAALQDAPPSTEDGFDRLEIIKSRQRK